MKEATKDIVIRAIKTFIQAFLSVVIVSLADITDMTTLKAALIAALAAGISAVWNSIKAYKAS